MSLKTGDYLLFASDLQHRPIGPKSFTDPPTDVIVQSAGAQAHKWHIENVDGKYSLTFNHLVAIKLDGHVVLIPFFPGPVPHLWNITPVNRAPPSPEPLYEISVPHESHEAWSAERGDPFVEVPVTIFNEPLYVAIVPAPE